MLIEIKTLTIQELYAIFRELGISTSQQKISDAIEQGIYPFAHCVQQKQRNFEIYEKPLRKWIIERADCAESNPDIVESQIIAILNRVRKVA